MLLDLRSAIYDVDDLEKAKEWYVKVLNAVPEVDQPSFVSFKIGENWLGLNLVDESSQRNDSSAVAYWTVPNVNEEHERLLELGAFSFREEKEGIRGQDELAEIFLPADQINALQNMDARKNIKENYFVIGVYEYVVARTKIFDRFFREALQENFEQIVFLGAGYDSRSYRFKEFLGSTKIFELDIPLTQTHKKQCLAKAGIDIPGQVSFVPINFNTESIEDALISTDFDKNKKTFFVWEGVTFYLSAEAVDATLEFVRSNSKTDSAIVFDYTALWPGIMDAYGVKELIEFNSKNQSGESAVSFSLNEDLIKTFLLERGFEISEYLNSEEIETSCLTLKDGTLFGHVTGSFRIVKALTMNQAS